MELAQIRSGQVEADEENAEHQEGRDRNANQQPTAITAHISFVSHDRPPNEVLGLSTKWEHVGS